MHAFNIAVWTAALAVLATGKAEAGINVWTSIGPFGGFAHALAIDPQNPDTVFAGTTGGIFKTTNGGTSWNAMNSGLPRGYIARALAIDPQKPNLVYAAGACGTYGPCGIFKSADGGTSWKAINSGLESVLVAESLAIDPKNSDILYAGTSACFQTSGTPGWVEGAENLCYRPGVFKSADGGASWTNASTGLPWASVEFGFVQALAIDPGTPGTVYAAAGGGVYKTTDGGTSWSSLHARATAIAIDPQNPGTLYAAGSGISKTTDGGASWSLLTSGPSNCCGSLAIDPRNPNVIYAGVHYGGAWKSTDGGATWADAGVPSLRDNSLAVDPTNPAAGFAHDPQNPGTVYVATNGMGIFKSTGGTGDWQPVNQGLSATSVYDYALDPQNPDTIYAETNGGIIKSTDGGMHWDPANLGLPVFAGDGPRIAALLLQSIAIDAQAPNTLYVGVSPALGNAQQSGSVFKSIDGGANWISAASPLGAGLFLLSLVTDPQSPNTLYAAGFHWNGVVAGVVSEIRKSTDGGNNWTPAGAFPSYVRQLVIDAQGTLYAVTNVPVYRSTDGGASWTSLVVTAASVGDCEECVPIGTLAVDPQQPRTIYVGGAVGILKSSDGGSTWEAMNYGLPLSTTDFFGVTALVIDPHNSSTLYAVMAGKVYRSTDGAASWKELSAGMTSTSVSALRIDSRNPSTVYAATYGGGIFAVTFVPDSSGGRPE